MGNASGGSVTLQVYKTTYANMPTWTSIGTLTVTSAYKNAWDIANNSYNAVVGDYWAVNINSISTFTLLCVNFYGHRL